MMTLTTSTTRRLGGALLGLTLGPILGAGDARAQTTETLSAAKDSFLRSGAADRNEGANPGLRLQASGHNRVVVGFDQGAIEAFLAANDLTTATLVLTIAENADNWGKNMDRTVDAHPLTVDFAEGDGQNAGVPGSQSTRGSGPGVTWNCAQDTEIANQATDCDPRWNGGTFGPATAAPVLHVNGLSGEVRWDVTEDVQAGVSAWLLKKTAEGQPGQVTYHSKQGANPALAPRLLLEGQEPFLCGGETSKCVFATSTIQTGNLGGLAGGDAICQARAEAPGSLAAPGTYKAWLSTAAASAASRLTHAEVPYRLVDGTTIANDWTDLTDGTLDAPINRQENDIVGPVRGVWTGTNADGSFQGSDCAAWSSAASTGVAGTSGSTGETDFQWTFFAIQLQCSPQLPLYCFQQ
jgi:hypothetical protein